MALPKWVRVGVSFRDETNPRSHETHHIRAVVDGMVVTRRWFKSKRRWHYEVIDPYFFEARKDTLRPSKR